MKKACYCLLFAAGLFCMAQALSAAPPSKAAIERFSYAGQIVDEHGTPIGGVDVVATERMSRGFGYIDTVRTDDQGHFTISRKVALSGARPGNLNEDVIRLEFSSPNFVSGILEDLRLMDTDQATHLKIAMRAGRSVRGQLVDAQQHGVASALIVVTIKGSEYSTKNLVTGPDGRFEIHGLPLTEGLLSLMTTQSDQPALTGKRPLSASETDIGVFALSPVAMPAEDGIHHLFGMTLADGTPQLQEGFHLHRATGVVVLDPGAKSEKLGIGKLQRGDLFWNVGDVDVKNYAEFKSAMVRDSQLAGVAKRCRVVYSSHRPGFSGSTTSALSITPAMVSELTQPQATRDALFGLAAVASATRTQSAPSAHR